MEVGKYYFLILVTIASITTTLLCQTNQYFVKPDLLEYNPSKEDILNEFCKKVKFTQSGIRCFLHHTFSRSEYAEEFLPHNFCHFIEFLEFGKDSNQDINYIVSTIKLFLNKLKSCSYATSDATLNLLDRLPDLLKPHFVKKQTSVFQEAKNLIKQVMYSMFLEKFNYFKQDPEHFFDDLSNEIFQTLDNSEYTRSTIDHEQLRQYVIRFLEIVLNKIIWSPLDEEEIWISVKNISFKLEELHRCEIISEDELDDLFQSLIERFIYFLDSVGSDLSKNTIDLIKKDIDAKNLLFLTLEEQEEFIEPKIDRLSRAVERVERQLFVRQHGIVA